jgi:hypothetical protein
MIDVAAVLARPNEHPPEISPLRPMICRPECPRKPGDSPRVCMRVRRGQSPCMYACFASDFLAECHEQQVASRTRSTALRVRFIVADREFKERFFVPNPPPPPPVSAQCMLGPYAERFVFVHLFISQEGYRYGS